MRVIILMKMKDYKKIRKNLIISKYLEENFDQNVDYAIPAKIRNFEHKKGNWASYVYSPFNINIGQNLIDQINRNLMNVQFFVMDHPLHISLSNTFVLKHHWINLFLEELRNKIGKCDRFSCTLGELQIYENEEKTRNFIGINIKSGNIELKHLSDLVINILAKYNITSDIYKDPSFHVSICWMLNNSSGNFTAFQFSEIKKILSPYFYNEVIEIQCLRFKTGNKIYDIKLKS
ncbi:U6 snRNA phosphodiesterase 1-like isoform X2 [Gordionus sp. m RMFG-2023]|uniref:U6 snRNA phosphodiesterase 1-like isoform X2 n=1 Tax=Gordionus sp. m RMFG-2023 TaxID=3053472 RepID=UPI0031FD14C3